MGLREPIRGLRRLIAVSTILLVLALTLGAVPVAAQSTGEAQAGPSLEASIGLGGFSAPGEPTVVAATITSPVLISGRLRVRGADVAVSRPIEVPAGGEQIYTLSLPPLEDGTRLTVEVLDTEGDDVVSDNLSIRAPSREELIVGVMGGEEIVTALGRVRGTITDLPVTAMAVSPDTPLSSLEVLDYLVLAADATEATEAMDRAIAWAEGGGVVVVDSSLGDGITGTPLPIGVEGAASTSVGSGRVIIVESLATRSAEDWSEMLRPTAIDFIGSPEFGFADQRGLIQAASEAGNRQVPSLPWLLFAILGFALLVGPVNFVVLSRLGKRDWAWLTIPAISVVAVAGFWVAGRQRISGTNLTHATVIVDEGNARARSALIVAAGVAGERSVAFDEGVSVFPERSLTGGAGVELQLDGEGLARVDLEQLGFTGIGITSGGAGLPEAEVRDGRLVVNNTSELSFWGWGAMMGNAASLAAGDLGLGAEGDVGVPNAQGGNFGFGFIDALMNEQQLWEDPIRSNSLWSLSQVLTAEADTGRIYFVGITDDYVPDVTVDGASAAVPGPTVVLVAAESESSAPAARAAATLVGTGFVSWVDWGFEQVVSTDEMTVRFRLPDPSLESRLIDEQRFGVAPQAYEAWNWEGAEFVEVGLGEPVDGAFVSPDGEVYVRLLGANEAGDNPMSPSSLWLEWGT